MARLLGLATIKEQVRACRRATSPFCLTMTKTVLFRCYSEDRTRMLQEG